MQQDDLTTSLLLALRHSGQALALSDPTEADTPIVAISEGFATMTGYGPDRAIGRNCRFLQGPATDRDTVARIRAALDAQSGCIEWIVNHRPDGRPYWNLLFIAPIRDPRTGQLRYFLGNQLDITLGTPDWLGDDVAFGRARMTPAIEREFHAGLATLLATAGATAGSTPDLTPLIAQARRLAELTTTLARQDYPPIPALA